MSVDAFPILPADTTALSTLCQNSLTDAQVQFAEAALRNVGPKWSLDCCESCDADWFLDLSSMRPDGRAVSIIIHARNRAIEVFQVIDDDHVKLGCFDDIAHAIPAVLAAIMPAPP